MKVWNEISLKDFEAWSGGRYTLDQLINQDKCEELESILDELYPDGLSATQLNDTLWHDSEWVFESVGLIGNIEEV